MVNLQKGLSFLKFFFFSIALLEISVEVWDVLMCDIKISESLPDFSLVAQCICPFFLFFFWLANLEVGWFYYPNVP